MHQHSGKHTLADIHDYTIAVRKLQALQRIFPRIDTSIRTKVISTSMYPSTHVCPWGRRPPSPQQQQPARPLDSLPRRAVLSVWRHYASIAYSTQTAITLPIMHGFSWLKMHWKGLRESFPMVYHTRCYLIRIMPNWTTGLRLTNQSAGNWPSRGED